MARFGAEASGLDRGALQDPEFAVEEIERCAPDRRFVQVLVLAMGEFPFGWRAYWPVYAAALRRGLPIGSHAGSSYRHPVTSGGWPTSYAEDYASQAQGFQAQLTSLMTEGGFRTGRPAAGAGRQRCERLVDAFGPRLGSRPFWSTASHAAVPACWRKRPSPT
jgi:hypothetical protein